MSSIQSVPSQWVQRAYESGASPTQTEAPAESGFAQRLGELVNAVDGLQDQSAELQTSAIRGEDVAAHDIMIASEEAGLAFTLMVEIRNKLVEAYQELMRMQA